MSFRKGSWTGEVYIGEDGRDWRKYDSFSEATMDFGKAISETYFSNERYSVVSINDLENYETAYCGGEEEWTTGVLSIMTSIYQAAGIEVNYVEYDGDSTVVEFALQFVGEGHSRFTSYKPPENNITFYGNPMTCEADWCAMFVSYCYHKCELIPDILPRPFRGCVEYSCMKKQTDRWRPSKSYTPNSGDIIFFDWNGDGAPEHTGIVVKCDGIKVHTVEGNTGSSNTNPYWKGSKVSTKEYTINSKVIFGYFAL